MLNWNNLFTGAVYLAGTYLVICVVSYVYVVNHGWDLMKF